MSNTIDDAAATRLLDVAREARQRAYAPYSHFAVGAALLADDGRTFTGVNVENAAYPLSTCAERSALVTAVGAGATAFRALAVAGPDDSPGCTPCGACRQILHEFSPDAIVISEAPDRRPVQRSLRGLLPDGFGPDTLRAHDGGR